jgi:AsmA family protein
MRWKWILAGVAGMIALCVAAVYILLSGYQFNDLKPRVVQAAKDATGRELKLSGDIQLKVGMTPSLVVDQVSFQNASWGTRPELATVRRIEVQVALIPLLSKKIVVRRFILEGMDVLIETDKSGKSNLAFKTGEDKPAAQSSEEGTIAGSALAALTFHEVRIEQGLLTYRDGLSGKTDALAVEKLTISASAADSPIKMALKGAFNDKPVEVEGTVGPLLGLIAPGLPWPLKLSAKAGGAVLKLEGEVKDALQKKRSFAVSLDVQGPSIPEAVKLAGVAGVPEVGPFSINARMVGRGSELSVEKMDIQAGTEDLAKVVISGAIKNPAAQRGIDIDFKINGKDLANAGQLTGRPLPVKGPFHLSGHAADTAEKAYKITDFKAALGENDVGGELEVNLAGKRPRVNGSLASQKLDLRTFLPKGGKTGGGAGAAKEAGTKRDKVFSHAPISVDALKQADATLQIRAGQILTPRLAFRDLSVHVALEDGTLDLKPFKGNLGGGGFDARLNVVAKGRGVGLQTVVKVNGLDLGRITKDLEITEKLSGHLNLDLDVRGTGGSVAELMAGLSGKTLVVGSNVQLDNKYVELLGADISGSVFRLLNPFSHEEKRTDITCMVSGFEIRDGIAQSTALVVDTKRMSVVGEGKINLKTEQLDVSLKPSPKEGAGISGLGKVGLSAGELAKSFKLAGTLAKPSLAIDPTQTALTIGKAVGGSVLFGPAGIAASLATGGKGDENPCLTAIEAAKKGVKPAGDSAQGQGVIEKTTEGAKGAVKGTGDRLKRIFGR